MARYRFAQPFVLGGRALDVACGSGYGLPLLRARAPWVVGVDTDRATLRDARTGIDAGAALLVAADGAALPFPDGSFSAITSFETIEHLHQRTRFVGEMRRVLAPEGTCIVSTPNANHTTPVAGKPRNPHHVFEYTPSELRAELERHFSDVRLLGQALDPRFSISPFIDEQEKLPSTIVARARLLVWRALNKLPVVLREALSAALWQRPFFPGSADYLFSETLLERAPVQVAICRGGRSGDPERA